MLLDNPTGFPDFEDKFEDEIKNSQETLVIAEHLQQLTETKGWKILKDFLEDKVKTLTEQLIQTREPETIRQIQCMIIALRFLPEVVNNLFLDAERAQEVLSVYQEQLGQAPPLGQPEERG